jgi:cobalt-zinc-cadmium efflux system protein
LHDQPEHIEPNEHHHDHEGHDHQGHDHRDGHAGHHHGPDAAALVAAGTPRVAIALAANGGLLLAQVIGAVTAGSLALLADSVHQASDVVGLVIAFVALVVSRRPATSRYTYGLRGVDVLGGALIGLLLCGSAIYIVIEAIDRFGEDTRIRSGWVIALALIGIVVNGGAAVALAGARSGSLAIKGAFTHLLADAAGSVGVLVSGIAVAMGGSTDWDPAISLVLAVMIAVAGLSLIKRSSRLLLDRAPIPVTDIESLLLSQPGVEAVHHVHVWPIGATEVAVSAHVVFVGDRTIHEAQEQTEQLNQLLTARLGVSHSTLQAECHPCAEPTHGALST